ncbi:MAG: Hsp20/alpha crystallin family protein [Bacteroidota bacterium]
MEIIRKNNRVLPSFFSDVERDFFGSPEMEQLTNVAVNVKENKNEFVIEMAVPGFKKEDLQLHIDGDRLTVEAEMNDQIEEEKDRYTRREFKYGTFKRTFTLPKETDVEKIEATCNNGVVEINIPKPEAQKKTVKRIELK